MQKCYWNKKILNKIKLNIFWVAYILKWSMFILQLNDQKSLSGKEFSREKNDITGRQQKKALARSSSERCQWTLHNLDCQMIYTAPIETRKRDESLHSILITFVLSRKGWARELDRTVKLISEYEMFLKRILLSTAHPYSEWNSGKWINFCFFLQILATTNFSVARYALPFVLFLHFLSSCVSEALLSFFHPSPLISILQITISPVVFVLSSCRLSVTKEFPQLFSLDYHFPLLFRSQFLIVHEKSEVTCSLLYSKCLPTKHNWLVHRLNTNVATMSSLFLQPFLFLSPSRTIHCVREESTLECD